VNTTWIAPTTGRWAIAAIVVVVAVGTGACGTQGGSGVEAQRSAETDLSAVAPEGGAGDFRAALAATPLMATIDIGPTTSAQAESRSAAIVVGTLRRVDLGAEHLVSASAVACESKEGTPTGETCPVDLTMQMINFAVVVDGVKMLPGYTGEPIKVGTEVLIEVPLGNGAPNAGPSKAAGLAIKAAAPIGSRFAAYVFQNPAGALQRTHPDSFALIDENGTFESLAVVGSAPGLLGLERVEELGID
jgi:hypothetical protein